MTLAEAIVAAVVMVALLAPLWIAGVLWVVDAARKENDDG